MLRKKKFSNFTRTTLADLPQDYQGEIEIQDPAHQFSITTKNTEIKAYLKKLQKQLEGFPMDAGNERFEMIKRAINMLSKHLKRPMVVEFLGYIFLKEIQALQRNVTYLTHRLYYARKLTEMIKNLPIQKSASLSKILLSLIFSEKDMKIRESLMKCLIKLYKKMSKAGEEYQLQEDIFNEFMTMYQKNDLVNELSEEMIKLIMHMIMKDKEKLEAFTNLLFVEAKKDLSLLGYFVKLIRKAGIESFKDELVCAWAKKILEVVHVFKQLASIQIEIIEFFIEIFNKDFIQGLREEIFSFYCESVRNFNVSIKRKATEAIGKVKALPLDVLVQTLKKEELADYKRKKKLKNDAITTTDVSFTRDNTEALALNRITGTFVFLLEDELSDIRITAINSIRNLAENFPEFAKETRDVLFYMLHDEMDQVRITALEGLAKVLKEISLGPFEKDSLLFNIREEVFLLRVGIYKLLKIVRVADQEILEQVINGLLANLEVFHEDKDFIFECLRALIMNNKNLTESYLNDLLAYEEKFLVQEPDWKSTKHIGKMIILATAASIFPHLVKLYPYYYDKHRSYLSDIFPEYFREHAEGEANKNAQTTTALKPRPLGASLLPVVSQNQFGIPSIIFQEIINCFSKKMTVEQCIKILKNLEGSFQSMLKGAKINKNLLKVLLEIVQNYFKLLSDIRNSYSLQALFSKWNDSTIYETFVQMINIQEIYKINDSNFEALLSKLKFFFLSFCLTKLINNGINITTTSKSIHQKKILEIALFLFNNFKSNMFTEDLKTAQEVFAALESFVRNPNSILKAETLAAFNAGMLSFLKSLHIQSQGLNAKVLESERINAEIIEPVTNLEDSTEFHSQLFVTFNIMADIHNLQNVQEICIAVKSQDERISMFKISVDDIIFQDNQTGLIKIRSKIHLDYGWWNRSSMIEMFLVKLSEPLNGHLIHLLDNHAFASQIDSQVSGRFFVISNQVRLSIRPIH